SALFCTEDPGGAGPLWLPQGGTGGTGGAAVADATGQARPGGPCAQEGLAVTSADGDVLTCRLTGGGAVPGGLYWQWAPGRRPGRARRDRIRLQVGRFAD